MLFKHTLNVDPFIQIKYVVVQVLVSWSVQIHCRRPFGTEPEFFIQLFVEPDESLGVPTIEILLKKMFQEQQISFASVSLSLPQAWLYTHI